MLMNNNDSKYNNNGAQVVAENVTKRISLREIVSELAVMISFSPLGLLCVYYDVLVVSPPPFMIFGKVDRFGVSW